jgi:hypothetical protein
MEHKETAVEWLYGVFELYAKGKREAPNWWDLERAIHMEKEQILDAFQSGYMAANNTQDLSKLSEDFYDKKYL